MSGGDEFARYARDLAAAADRLEPMKDDALDAVGLAALSIARDRAPVLTGELRGDLRVTRKGDRVSIESSTDHSVFVEGGTSRMAPQPFIAPAFQEGADRLVHELERIRDATIGRL